MDILDFKTTRFNIVGAGSHFKGELHCTGPSTVAGRIEGELWANQETPLTLEKTSHVSGRINAYDVEIHGVFEGELNALGTLTLRPGSVVSGTIKAARLVIYPGALLNSETQAGS